MDGGLIIIIISNNGNWVTKTISYSPINVTLDGIVTELNTVDNPAPPISNILSPMTVSPEMNSISLREEQAANDWKPKTIIILIIIIRRRRRRRIS